MKKIKIIATVILFLVVLVYFLFFHPVTSMFTFVFGMKFSNKINRYDHPDVVHHYGFAFGDIYTTKVGVNVLGACVDDYVFNLWSIMAPINNQKYIFNQYDLSKFSILLNDSLNDRHVYAYYSSDLVAYPVLVFCKNIVMEIYPMHELNVTKAWRRIQEFIPKCRVNEDLNTDYNIPLKNGSVIPRSEVLKNLHFD